jgi:hypothetical protein
MVKEFSNVNQMQQIDPSKQVMLNPPPQDPALSMSLPGIIQLDPTLFQRATSQEGESRNSTNQDNP